MIVTKALERRDYIIQRWNILFNS